MRVYSRGNEGGAAPAFRPDQRERSPIVHHSVHETREAEVTRMEDVHPEYDASRTFNPTSLEAPPPRPGMVQRWITDATQPNATKSEKRNWFAKQRQGWQLRDPDTVPANLRHLYPSAKLADGQTAIQVAGMVLGEMSVNQAEQRRLAVNDRIQHLTAAIPESTQELTRRGEGRFGPVQQQDDHRSYRGRKPATMA